MSYDINQKLFEAILRVAALEKEIKRIGDLEFQIKILKEEIIALKNVNAAIKEI